MKNYYYNGVLYHHGIKGQKWGIRRYQNPDGTYTAAGKKHRKNSVFISGSSKTTFEDSGYYRKDLPPEIQSKISDYMSKKFKIIVGDAPGVDSQVQDYLKRNGYKKVEVYGPGKKVRYLADPKWKNRAIDAPEYEPYSKEWLAKKDIEMTNRATEGLAIVLDEGAKATRRNVDRLIEQNKDVMVYELNKAGSDYDKWTRRS